ncbi:MAG: hypothetical protein IKL33_03520, partial [Alphaproteobacteria bacterium]|nr:hypothetical protein [Alphaproteobacteria bacterium]
MMIKGLSELSFAPVQIDALEMILIRIAFSASLPTPYEILNDVKKNSNLVLNSVNTTYQAPKKSEAEVVAPVIQNTSKNSDEKHQIFNTPEELAKYLEAEKKVLLAYTFKHDLSFSEFSNGKIKFTVSEKVNNDFLLNLQNILIEATGQKWDLEVLRGHLGETIADKEQALDNANKKSVSDLPLVKAILSEFKGSKIETLTRKINKEEEASSEFETTETYFDEDL